jgi:Transposase DDE domain
MLGLDLEHLVVDGCITKAPCGGEVAGPSPVDRRKQGLKRSVAVEAGGIPLAAVPAPANQRDDGLLAATLDALGVVGALPARPVVHLDAGYDYQPCRQVLAERGMAAQIAARGVPAPIQVGRRWVVERTHGWGNQYGKLRWCTERRRPGGVVLAGADHHRHRLWPAAAPRLDPLPLAGSPLSPPMIAIWCRP